MFTVTTDSRCFHFNYVSCSKRDHQTLKFGNFGKSWALPTQIVQMKKWLIWSAVPKFNSAQVTGRSSERTKRLLCANGATLRVGWSWWAGACTWTQYWGEALIGSLLYVQLIASLNWLQANIRLHQNLFASTYITEHWKHILNPDIRYILQQ